MVARRKTSGTGRDKNGALTVRHFRISEIATFMAVDYSRIDKILESFDEEADRLAYEGPQDNSLESAEALLKLQNETRIKYTGKKSELANLKKMIGQVDPSERAEFAKRVQSAELAINSSLDAGEQVLKDFIEDLKIKRERLDVTLPGIRPRTGHLHPLTLLRQQIEDIFVSLGYTIEDDREIETDHYNFDALNIPEGHPARESQDTFYTTTGLALRSQTSTVQIRAMERHGAPLRIIAPGRVFRRDTPDLTHTPMFHQIEGLCVDRGITMAHLKGTVTEWLRRLFGPETITRFRPSYFPFTEPSAEFDFSCFKCKGTGVFDSERCRPCKGTAWIELGGSGMVHPNVLRACNVDPEEFTGFAFGFGLERMCSLMYSLDDIRYMFDNDVRFLEQFK
jgi:phenylalanyl-tRNA synthetase alpha chain